MKQFAVLCGIFSLFATSSFAVLGQKATSVDTDKQFVRAQVVESLESEAFTIQVLRNDSGSVREYVNSSGTVFAIAWNGYTQPDLSPLLGDYDSDYQSALAQSPHTPGRRSSTIKGHHVVVEKWGQMRNLSGRAYDPSLIPGGVRVEDIQ